MKTWEVYKNELEQATQIYIRKVDGVNYCFDKVYGLLPCNWRGMGWTTIKVDDDWELVPQEVTWQEAIQAWANGEKVHYVFNNTKVYLDNIYYLRTIYAGPISRDEISKAKWFIG